MIFFHQTIRSFLLLLLIFTSQRAFSLEIYKGFDISYYQGSVNFTEVSSDGYNYIYIRAGEGGDIVDEKFYENYKSAEESNIHYGFYYYVTAKNITEAEIQGNHFADLIENTSYSLRPAMDFEVFEDISIDESNAIALTFLKKVEEMTEVTPVIYSDANNVETRWDSSLSDFPLWVADYGHLVDPENYTLPENYVWEKWSGYQYSDSGSIKGIDGSVDCDLFTSDLIISENEKISPSTSDNEQTDLFISHSVKKNDTLWKLSEFYGISISEIANENKISDINLIYVGETLKIPMKEIYTVKSGDTLLEIATDFQTSTEILAHVNQIKDINILLINELLYIPL